MWRTKLLTAAAAVALMTLLSGGAMAQRPFRAGEVCVPQGQVADDLSAANDDFRTLERFSRFEHPMVRVHIAALRAELVQLNRTFNTGRWDRRFRRSNVVVCVDRDDLQDNLDSANTHIRELQRFGRFERSMRMPLRELRHDLRALSRTVALNNRGRFRGSYDRYDQNVIGGTMSDNEFARFLADVHVQATARERAAMIKNANETFTVGQLVQLLAELPYSQFRVDVAANVRVADPENFAQVYTLIPNEGDRDELRRRVARRYDGTGVY